MKKELESLPLREDNCTIISIDVVNMYPSVRISLIKRAVKYFTKDLEREDKLKINDFLKMIEFGMNSTLITFQGKYY